MKKFLKLALIAIVAFASNNVFAQETIDMNLYGLKDKTWTVGQSLDGVSYTDEKSEIEISFSKGDGTADPTFIEYDTKKNGVKLPVIYLTHSYNPAYPREILEYPP